MALHANRPVQAGTGLLVGFAPVKRVGNFFHTVAAYAGAFFMARQAIDPFFVFDLVVGHPAVRMKCGPSAPTLSVAEIALFRGNGPLAAVA